MLAFLKDSNDFVCFRIGLITKLVLEVAAFLNGRAAFKLIAFNALLLIILFKPVGLQVEEGIFLFALLLLLANLFRDGLEIDIGFFRFSVSNFDFVSSLKNIKNKIKGFKTRFLILEIESFRLF
jgi:hypothetical protein